MKTGDFVYITRGGDVRGNKREVPGVVIEVVDEHTIRCAILEDDPQDTIGVRVMGDVYTWSPSAIKPSDNLRNHFKDKLPKLFELAEEAILGLHACMHMSGIIGSNTLWLTTWRAVHTRKLLAAGCAFPDSFNPWTISELSQRLRKQ